MIRKSALVCSALILFGCGGGGGESNVTVTATASVGGYITPASQQIAKGSTVSLTVQPEPIYNIQTVSGCGGVLSGNTYTAQNVKSNCAVTASFKLKPLSMDVSSVSSVIAEKTEVVFDVVVANIKSSINLSIIAANDNALNSAAISKAGDTRFTITTHDVDRDLPLTFNVLLQDGNDPGRVLEKTISMTLENTSFVETLTKIKLLQSQRERLVDATEERHVIASMREVITLLNSDVSTAEISTLQNELPATELSSAIAAIRVDDYENGETADSELINEYHNAISLLEQHLAPFQVSLNQQLSYLAGSVTKPVQVNQFILTPSLNTASFFIGNPEFGQIVDGEFVFNENLNYLSGLLEPTCD